MPNELLIHACSPQSAKVIIITFAQWQMNCCKAGEAYLVAGDALSGWSGDARDWWLGNLLDLLIFLLDFFFLPGLSFFFWVLSLRSCSVFRLSVLFSLFRFCLPVFFSCLRVPFQCRSVVLCLSPCSFCSPVLCPLCVCSPVLLRVPLFVLPLCRGLSLAFIKPENAMRSCLSNSMHGGGERDRGQLAETNCFSFLLSRFSPSYVEGDEQFELKLRRFYLKWLFSNCPLNL